MQQQPFSKPSTGERSWNLAQDIIGTTNLQFPDRPRRPLWAATPFHPLPEPSPAELLSSGETSVACAAASPAELLSSGETAGPPSAPCAAASPAGLLSSGETAGPPSALCAEASPAGLLSLGKPLVLPQLLVLQHLRLGCFPLGKPLVRRVARETFGAMTSPHLRPLPGQSAASGESRGAHRDGLMCVLDQDDQVRVVASMIFYFVVFFSLGVFKNNGLDLRK